MHYRDNFNSIQDLITLTGDFSALSGSLEQEGDHYRYTSAELSVTTRFETHESGVTKRQDRIQNISARPVTLRTAYCKFNFNGGEYEVYTQYNEHCSEGHGQWQNLVTEVSARGQELRGSAVNAPFIALRNLQSGRGFVFHIADGCQWRCQVRKAFLQHGRKRSVTVELGPDNTDFCYTLAPGEILELPAILFYPFRNRTDLDAYKLHRYCNAHFMKKPLPVIYNSWMCSFDDISFDSLCQQLDIATGIGAEYFVVDAGWFGTPFNWVQSVGDWQECQSAGIAGRLKEFADCVRSRGLKFGLWFEIERAALTSEAYRAHPEYYLVAHDRAFLDFANPDATELAFRTICDHIRRYGIEFIKFDFNGVCTNDDRHAAFLPYFRGYAAFMGRLREAFPELYMEGCASGGMRLCLSTLPYFDSYWLTDNQNIHDQLDVFTSACLRMPSRALETWATVQTLHDTIPSPTRTQPEMLLTGDGDWRYLESTNLDFLCNAMAGGPISISCDLSKLSDAVLERLTTLITDFKAERSFWNHSECHILTQTDTLTVLQFCDPQYHRLKLYAFTKYALQNAVTVYPVCGVNATYQLADGTQFSARELDENGITLPLKLSKHASNQITLTTC